MRILLLDGNENHAVAAVRSLARAGHDVVVGADTTWSKAGWSRYAHSTFHYPAPRQNPNGFVERIVQLAREHAGTFVLPMTESSTLPISARRQPLIDAGARLVLPAHDAVLRAFDKEVTREIAAFAGVCTPRTARATSLEEAAAAADEIGYPVVLKASVSEAPGAQGGTHAAGAPRYARSAAALRSAFDALHTRAPVILVQEFVSGTGTGYFALMNRGHLRAEFAHRRIRDVRPTGSGSAVRESIAVDAAMRDASVRILRALDWHGVAMVEYKQHIDGRLFFLEVNGRFWNSLALAVHAGMDFPRLLAEVAATGDVAPTFEYRTGVRCRWLLGDARHLVSVFVGPPADFPGPFPRRLPTLAAFLRPTRQMHHDNFEWNDPMPEAGDWLHFFLRRVPGLWRRVRSSQ